MELNKIYNEDCLQGMKRIPDGSIDAIICDLPYGTTCNKWDTIIPFDELWAQYKRVIKPNGAIVLFSQQPFTSKLIMSNIDMFRYEWIWHKHAATGFLNANKMPLKAHENICVFYKHLPTYNPQKTKSTHKKESVKKAEITGSNYGKVINRTPWVDDGLRFPVDVVKFDKDKEAYDSTKIDKGLHPTANPVDLVAYLVRTYTKPGETVLDNCIGCGTTAISCIREHRNFIGFELNKEYFDKAQQRIDRELAEPKIEFIE